MEKVKTTGREREIRFINKQGLNYKQYVAVAWEEEAACAKVAAAAICFINLRMKKLCCQLTDKKCETKNKKVNTIKNKKTKRWKKRINRIKYVKNTLKTD